MVVYTGVDRYVDSRVDGLYIGVYTVVYTYTVSVQGRVTAVYGPSARLLHGPVHGPYTCTRHLCGRVHVYTAV